jgi:hypothetical protein
METMREDISRLREGRAAADVTLKALSDDVAALTAAVGELKTAIDRSRGALWVISGVAGLAGAVTTFIGMVFFHKGG